MNISKNKIIGEIVAEDYRTASVFEKFGIDFCCKGHLGLEDACQIRNVSVSLVMEEIRRSLSENMSGRLDFNSWALDMLADYIIKKHHAYIEEKIPLIKRYLDQLCEVHGKKHQELFEINKLFNHCEGELTAHLKKEEFILFPYIRRLTISKKENLPLGTPPFGSVQNPIQMMMKEHDAEGDRFRKISELSHNFNPPKDGCNTYRVSFALLKEFEADLHMHMHLENNILFPKAIKLERSFSE